MVSSSYGSAKPSSSVSEPISCGSGFSFSLSGAPSSVPPSSSPPTLSQPSISFSGPSSGSCGQGTITSVSVSSSRPRSYSTPSAAESASTPSLSFSPPSPSTQPPSSSAPSGTMSFHMRDHSSAGPSGAGGEELSSSSATESSSGNCPGEYSLTPSYQWMVPGGSMDFYAMATLPDGCSGPTLMLEVYCFGASLEIRDVAYPGDTPVVIEVAWGENVRITVVDYHVPCLKELQCTWTAGGRDPVMKTAEADFCM